MPLLLQALQAALLILAALPDLIKTVEAIHGTAAGATKKDLVLQLVADVLNQLSAALGIKLPTTLILNVAATAIDSYVAVFNAIGTFKKVPATPALISITDAAGKIVTAAAPAGTQ